MVSKAKSFGCSVVSFGMGILLASFLPDCVLIVLEAAVIVTAGILFSKS